MIKNICYCDKCKKEVQEDTQYFKIDVYKRKWYSLPDDVNDKDRGVAQQKLHLCETCMGELSSFLRGK